MFRFLAPIVVMLVILCAGWANAATSTDERSGCHAYEAECHTVSLFGGKVGETVRVCAKVRLVCSAERQGTTTVTHIR